MKLSFFKWLLCCFCLLLYAKQSNAVNECNQPVYPDQLVFEECIQDTTNMTWDSNTLFDDIAPNTNVSVAVIEGNGPYRWTVSGNGFFLDSGHSIKNITSESGSITIYTHNACGTGVISVSDNCSTLFFEIRSTDGQWVVDPNGSGCVGGNVSNDGGWSNIRQFTSINGGKKQVQVTNAPFRDVDVPAIKIRILACDATPKPYDEMMLECVAWAETVVNCPEPNTDEYCHADLVPATGSDVYSSTGFCLWNINAFDGCQNPYKRCVTQNNFYKWSCK